MAVHGHLVLRSTLGLAFRADAKMGVPCQDIETFRLVGVVVITPGRFLEGLDFVDVRPAFGFALF
jgi:hypothetical protein